MEYVLNVVNCKRKGVRYNMRKKMIINLIKNLGIAIILFSIIISGMISHNDYHLEVCHNHNCTICQMITIAKTIVEISALIITANFIAFIIYFVLSRIHKTYGFYVPNSLIFQKVQLNN